MPAKDRQKNVYFATRYREASDAELADVRDERRKRLALAGVFVLLVFVVAPAMIPLFTR